jgi:hypothetical protein
VHLLGTQGEIQAAAQGVAVDEHGVASRFRDRDCDGKGKHVTLAA